MKKLIVGVAAAVVLCATAAAVAATTVDGCPPLIECFDDEGTLFVRNERAEPIRVRFEKTGAEDTFEVRANAQGAYTDLACNAVRVIVLDAAGTELGHLDGPICANKTWTFDGSGRVTVTDGVPRN